MSTTTATLTIGLGHYRRVGKDTFANFLVEACRERDPKFAIRKRSFAYKLKQVCHDLYGWAGLREPEFYETLEGEKHREVVLPEIGKSPRQIWIDMGTKAVRQHVYEPTWLDYLLKGQHDLDVMVIPDVRFPNEAEAIREAGGVLVKIVRPGFGPGPDVADRALLGYDGWDYVIGGDAGSSESIGRLRVWADRFARWLVSGEARPEQSPEDRSENLTVEVATNA
jgi:hypothetical protein